MTSMTSTYGATKGKTPFYLLSVIPALAAAFGLYGYVFLQADKLSANLFENNVALLGALVLFAHLGRFMGAGRREAESSWFGGLLGVINGIALTLAVFALILFSFYTMLAVIGSVATIHYLILLLGPWAAIAAGVVFSAHD